MWEVGVKMPELDLDSLLSDQLNFAYSERMPISCVRYITSSEPYYYRWTPASESSSLDFVTFEKNSVKSIRFFRYRSKDIYKKINLNHDPPSFQGQDALDFLIDLGKVRSSKG